MEMLKLFFCDTETTDLPSSDPKEIRIPGLIQISGEIDYLYFFEKDFDFDEKREALLSKNDPHFGGITAEGKKWILVEKEFFDLRSNVFPSDTISDRALEVNKTTRDQIASFPSPKKTYTELSTILSHYCNKFDRADKFFFVGYNARFDDDRIREFFAKNNDKYYNSWFFFPPIDIMNQAIVRLMSQRSRLQDFKLETLAKFLDIDIQGQTHDAKTDIDLTKKIFLKLL